eukprot:Plantae.Rhodophyta-Purpureofilum_apyrenoidigerum.ctg41667.p1 GENE.Plantae.Rhodophyta-Purpureofilum_apyrenoidigerum.ctg41667~~Plantae.Rhodophyta-Purpureofilum_apyrenoidigerum.ctg41667.p1  ORF type:complete len:431 (-),score=38.55 Plantae.Rhodophyta-Purpureofilum_apyrenoidigerum.ctg41667:99-1391(-)
MMARTLSLGILAALLAIVLPYVKGYDILRGRLHNTRTCEGDTVMSWYGVNQTCMPITGINWAVRGGLSMSCKNGQIEAQGYDTFDCSGLAAGRVFNIDLDTCSVIQHPFDGSDNYDVSGELSCETSPAYVQACLDVSSSCSRNEFTRCVAKAGNDMCMMFGSDSVKYICGDKLTYRVYRESKDCSGSKASDEFTVEQNICAPIEVNGLTRYHTVQCIRSDEYQPSDDTGSNMNITTKGGRCFSANSQVVTVDGKQRQMGDIVVGDFVESVDKHGKRVFSEVFLVQHKQESYVTPMKKITFEDTTSSRRTVVVSAEHLIYSSSSELVSAGDVQMGNILLILDSETEESTAAKVIAVDDVHASPRNVHTLNDRLVVDGVVVTPYTTSFGINTYYLRYALMPLKMLHRLGFTSVVDRVGHLLHRCTDIIASHV